MEAKEKIRKNGKGSKSVRTNFPLFVVVVVVGTLFRRDFCPHGFFATNFASIFLRALQPIHLCICMQLWIEQIKQIYFSLRCLCFCANASQWSCWSNYSYCKCLHFAINSLNELVLPIQSVNSTNFHIHMFVCFSPLKLLIVICELARKKKTISSEISMPTCLPHWIQSQFFILQFVWIEYSGTFFALICSKSWWEIRYNSSQQRRFISKARLFNKSTFCMLITVVSRRRRMVMTTVDIAVWLFELCWSKTITKDE